MIPLLSSSELQEWLYIEDELFLNMHPTLLNDIGDIPQLPEDFFSLFPKEIRPWNSMLLWGGAHSRSPLHIDPYNWTGTNAVLKGTKKWKLFPPGQDHSLYVIPELRCGFPLECRKYNSKVDAFSPDFEKYPMFRAAKSIEFEQKSGELLIIPTGWYHQAYNLEETLAISGQTMNSHNYLAVLEEIIKVGNLQRQVVPDNFRQLSVRQQVRSILKSLPHQVLLQGRRVADSYKRTREEL
ncbi:F-box protein At1g78280-like [Argonauta hians]